MNSGRSEEPQEGKSGMPVLRILQTFWGVAAVVALAGYSLLHSFDDGSSVEGAAAVQRPQRIPTATAIPFVPGPVKIGSVTMYPFVAPEPNIVVHLACNSEDSRLARVYDPPPSGRAIVLRLDQSLEQMRLLYHGKDSQFPADTRLVTTPCLQAMIDSGEFP